MKLKRLLSLFLIALFALVLMPLTNSSMQAYAATNPYDKVYQDADGDGYPEVPCTKVAWQKAYDVCGVALPGWGNAGTWLTSAKASGYATGNTAKVNSIAVFSSGSYGHVSFVTAVNGNKMTVYEGGRTDLDHTSSHGVGTSNPSSVVGQGGLIGFIYLNGGTAPSGSPTTIQDTVYSIHSAINNNLVLDVANGKNANGTNIQTQKYHGGPAQRFNVVHRGSYYTIHAQCSNLLIDTENNSSTSGANIFTWSDTGANGQHWEFIDAGGGYYYIRSKNGLYLDVKDGKNAIQTNIIAHSFNGSNAQKWKLVEESKNIEEGYYSIKSAQNNNMVLDIQGQSQVNGGNLQLYSYNGSRAQVFYVKKENSNYIIKPLCSGLLIDTSSNSKTSGTNLQQWSNTGASGQRFKLVIAGDNNYFIRSNLGRFVDVYNGKYVNGTNINSHQFNGSKAQTWKFVKEDISRFRPKMPDVKVTGANGNVTIQWNSVDTEFKNKYDVRIYDMDKGTSNYIKVAWGVEGTSYALSLPKGNYGVTVAAVDKIDNKLFSDAKLVEFKVTDNGKVECDTHLWDSGHVTKATTCTADGVKTYTCSVCKGSKTEAIKALGHEFGTWTKLSNTQHQRVCANDSSHIEKSNHTWDTGKVTKAATCTADGVKTYTCSVCKGAKTEAIKAIGHKFGTWTKLSNTQHQRVCANDSSHIEKSNHTWDTGKVTKAATTSATGVQTYTCTTCKETTEESIPKLPDSSGKPSATTEQVVNEVKVNKSIPKIAAAKIKTIGSTSKKQMTIEIPKVTGATNYIVAYKTADAKTWKYYYTGGKNQYIIKSLKLNSMVQFRVAAYKNSARGDWSNISYRYMMTAKSSKAKAGKKSITVTWKKDSKATGYQVLYSTNKNMKGYKTITLKGASKTMRVIKGLKKGKTYYVRVRPIKKYKGKNYVGILAPIRSVKVK